MAELTSSEVLARQSKKDKDIENRLVLLKDSLVLLEEDLILLKQQIPTTIKISLNNDWQKGSEETSGVYTVTSDSNITTILNQAIENSKNIIITFIVGEEEDIEVWTMNGYCKGLSIFDTPCYHVYFTMGSSSINIHCWTTTSTLLMSSSSWNDKFNKGKFIITLIN